MPEINKYSRKRINLLMSSLTDFPPEKLPKPKQVKPNKTEATLLQKNRSAAVLEKFKKFKDIQIQRYDGLRKSQMKSQIELSNKMKKSMEQHIERKTQFEEFRKTQNKESDDLYFRRFEEIQLNKIRNERNMENDIIAKLQEFDNKIHRSEENHSNKLKEKIEKILRLREIFMENVMKKQEDMKKNHEMEKLEKIVEKHELVKSARNRLEEKIQKDASDKKEKFEKKRADALEKIKRAQKDFYDKSKGTERKMMASERMILEHKEEMNQELALKKELKRLKDHEGLIKIQRSKRRYVKTI